MAKVTKTKNATCIQCGVAVEINVLASPAKAKCEPCKTGGKVFNQPASPEETEGNQINVYGEKSTGPRIDGSPNKALHRLACPYHPHQPMDIIGVIKNDMWGDIVSFQCRERGCWTVVQISEQAKNSGAWRTTVDGTSFEPDEVRETLREGKMDEWCEQHGVEQRPTQGV